LNHFFLDLFLSKSNNFLLKSIDGNLPKSCSEYSMRVNFEDAPSLEQYCPRKLLNITEQQLKYSSENYLLVLFLQPVIPVFFINASHNFLSLINLNRQDTHCMTKTRKKTFLGA